MHLILLLLLLLPLSSSLSRTNCPTIPSTCSCHPEESGFLTVSCEGNTSLPILFKDLGALPLARLKLVKCSQSVLNILPKGSIKILEIVDCGVKEIDNKILPAISSSLEELILSNNSLEKLPELGGLQKLTNLDLSGNKIEEIPENIFNGIKNLQQLRLEGNKICNLSSKSLEEVKDSLRLLDLSGNCLSRIPAHNLRNNNRLVYLNLADNKISEINNFEFMNLPMLQEIRLNNNELRTLHPMAFMNVPQLKYLYIRDNLLSTLDGNKLQGLSQLEVLDATKNLLSKVPTLKDFPRLRQVFLDGNLIEKIDTLTFSNNSQLQLISLQNNNILQIARNSFDSLDQMQVLMLGNNSLTSIDRGILDGMRGLTYLQLRNNSIEKIDPAAFLSVLHLHSLDVALNKLTAIEPQTFVNHGKLQWLDLSNNKLASFEANTFNTKLETLVLNGNPWNCDEKFDAFVTFLVVNKVRTFLPQQAEIICEQPKGVRLRELMMKKANETMRSKASQPIVFPSLLPGLNFNGGLPSFPQPLPGLGMNPGPLQKVTNNQPVLPQNAQSIHQVLQSLPNMVINLPGFGPVDLSKLDPNIIDFVLKGGQIPGIPKETMDEVIRRVYQAASSTNKVQEKQMVLQSTDEIVKRPTGTVRLPILPTASSSPSNSQMTELWKLLPPNYNISKIPPDVLTAVMKGELPDMSRLPEDLLEHFKVNTDKMVSIFSKINPNNASLDDILAKLPKFEKPQLATFSPYDINKLTSDMIHDEEVREKAVKMRIYTGIALGLVGTITLIVLGFFVVYLKKQRAEKTQLSSHSSFPSSQL